MKTLTLVLALFVSSLASASEGYVCGLGGSAEGSLATVVFKMTEPGKLSPDFMHLGYDLNPNTSLTLVSDMMGVQSYDNQKGKNDGQILLVLNHPTAPGTDSLFSAELSVYASEKYLLTCYAAKEVKAASEYTVRHATYDSLVALFFANPEILVELKAKFPKAQFTGFHVGAPVMESLPDHQYKTTQDYRIETSELSGDIMRNGPTIRVHRETISYAYGVLTDQVTYEFVNSVR